ncbi:Coq4 family protein [Acaryochloris sp. IP29b_bin.148]|uniref:Coq4 family protein n=1 Tax=Acaryochloris sp. IP29b_bin.148 TaxID=2969218 RepID=UPI0026302E67|nr:Coq4 family protein [Acaryochloris sp. IP29b_bin.148]
MDSSHPLASRQRFSFFSLAVQAYRQGKLGDVAAYKSAILGTTAYPEIAETLSRLKTCFPTIDLAALRSLPEGTFGQIYAQHMDECHLTPLEISADIIAALPDQSLGLRYTLLHDVFHVLLG